MANVPKADPQAAVKYFEAKLNFTTGPIELSHWLKEAAPVNVIDVRAPEDYEKGHIPGHKGLSILADGGLGLRHRQDR